MKNLIDFIECELGGSSVISTPSNTLGVGNPGPLDSITLSEPLICKKAKTKKEKLKKTQESLLDNEDTIISNAIKDANNPFQFVFALINNNEDLFRHKQEIEKIFDKFIKTIKSKHPIEIITQSNGIKLRIQHHVYDPLIILRPGHLWPKNDDPYGFSGDQQLVIFFTEPFREDYLYYGFKDERYYRDWIHTISKKYNLKQSKKDEFVYYI